MVCSKFEPVWGLIFICVLLIPSTGYPTIIECTVQPGAAVTAPKSASQDLTPLETELLAIQNEFEIYRKLVISLNDPRRQQDALNRMMWLQSRAQQVRFRINAIRAECGDETAFNAVFSEFVGSIAMPGKKLYMSPIRGKDGIYGLWWDNSSPFLDPGTGAPLVGTKGELTRYMIVWRMRAFEGATTNLLR